MRKYCTALNSIPKRAAWVSPRRPRRTSEPSPRYCTGLWKRWTLVTVTAKHPRVEIEYCTQCRWLLRAAWTAQELLTTFQDEIGEMALIPGTGGVFDIRGNEGIVWSRAARDRSPEINELKQFRRA